MPLKWFGLAGIIVITSAIIAFKTQLTPPAQAADANVTPRVLLVAELSEANNASDACAEIIHIVEETKKRGVATLELDSDSKSELLARYHVLIVPTVLILDREGNEVSRYEGEGRKVVNRLRAELAQLK